MFRPIAALVAVVVLVALAFAGRAAFKVADTAVLTQDQLEALTGPRISRDGYRLDVLAQYAQTPDLLVLVALSGGGKRSAAFGYGALKGMREVMVPTASGPRPLLNEVDAILGVSGGSFPAAYYGLHREAAFGRFEQDFLYADTEEDLYGIYLLPWNWTWIADPDVGTNDFMERVYDRTLFHGAKYSDLQARGRPLIVIGATDLSYGTPFEFTQDSFDLLCSNLEEFPLARAVAASNGFPGLLSPITMTNHAAECGGRTPLWLRGIGAAERLDPRSRLGEAARRADRYLAPDQTRYVHLVDGGVSDNLAIREVGALMQAATVQQIGTRGFSRFRRVLLISVDGQGAQDVSNAQRKDVGGLFSLLGLASGAQIDRYNFETLIVVSQQLQSFAQNLREARCSQGPVVQGTRCDDVQAELVHVALADLPDGPRKHALLAIPTGLTIARPDIDHLIEAGQTAIVESMKLRRFLAGYPAAPGALEPVAAAPVVATQ